MLSGTKPTADVIHHTYDSRDGTAIQRLRFVYDAGVL